MTPAGIEPAQHLNHHATTVPIIFMYFFHKTFSVKESQPSGADGHFSVGQ